MLFKEPITSQQLKDIRQLEAIKEMTAFSPYSSDYFSRLYSVLVDVKQFQLGDGLSRLKAIAPVERVEVPEEVYPLTIRPHPRSQPVTNDPLVNFQWALESNGQQVVLPNGTNIDSEFIHSLQDSDLGITDIIDQMEAKVERDLVVAVVDFGVDYNHPEIVNSIAYNSIECDKGKNPSHPKEDRDGNGYKGDCLGWNLTSESERGEDNNPMDKVGHGTHIAGIIAAEKNNGQGIAGVSNKLKVLPIKVMHRWQSQGSDPRGKSFTDKVAKGILYAITRGVDVINLSLGWPSSLDNQHIRQAVREAIDKGIIVVAAAGNNKNSRPIAPCSYPDVLCVGSSRIDKKVASFSNFGAHVDVVAPGDQILSLFPFSIHNKYRANIFNLPGYEVKSGTSQSAPYVSAVAALLKGALKIDADEVKARIFSSAKDISGKGVTTRPPVTASPLDERRGEVPTRSFPIYRPKAYFSYVGGQQRRGRQQSLSPRGEQLRKGKYFRDGLVHLERAYRVAPHPVLRPEFKNLELLVVDSQSGKFSFPLTIKNYWAKSQGFKVKVRSLSPHIVVNSGELELSALDRGETHRVSLTGTVGTGTVGNRAVSHIAKWSVTLIHQGKQREYPVEFILAQELSGQEKLKTVAIDLDDELKQAFGKAFFNSLTLPLRTIIDFKRQSTTPEYYFKSQSEEGMKLKILQWVENSYQVTREILLPSEKGRELLLLSFHRDDFEGDGQAEYIIRTGYENEQQQAIVNYTFLNSQFAPYYGPHYSTWEFNVAENNSLIFQQKLNKLQFLPFSLPPFLLGVEKKYGSLFLCRKLFYLKPMRTLVFLPSQIIGRFPVLIS